MVKNDDSTEHGVSLISKTLIESSKFYYTSLSVVQYPFKKSQIKSDVSNDTFTIGDDTEHMYNELKKYNKYQYNKSESQTEFLEGDDTFTEIECKRKSYAKHTRSKRTLYIFAFLFLSLSNAFLRLTIF